MWRFYPETGAALTLAGATVALAGVLWPRGVWANYPLAWRAVALFGAVVALDDAVSHAFGVWTPVDAVWKAGVYSVLG